MPGILSLLVTILVPLSLLVRWDRVTPVTYKSMQQLFAEIVEERGMFCEECRFRLASELHHAILRRSKKHPEYDCKENLELVCRMCHATGNLDTFDHTCKFWRRQKERGYDMDAWIKSLNLKSREFYD